MNRFLLACACLILSSAPAMAAETAPADAAACPPGLPADADLGRCAEQAAMAHGRLYVAAAGRLRGLPIADDWSDIGRQPSKTTYRVQVVGDDGQPVPYATLWSVALSRREPTDVGALMNRLVSNYAYDVARNENAPLSQGDPDVTSAARQCPSWLFEFGS